jgi:hypothetical protein
MACAHSLRRSARILGARLNLKTYDASLLVAELVAEDIFEENAKGRGDLR